MYYVSVYKNFSAAHHLRDYAGKCEKVHGHNYQVEVELKSKALNKTGMVADFNDIKDALEKLLARFDHQDLNEVKPFDKINPTAENIARVVFEEMALKFNSPKVKINKVSVWETEHAKATYGPF
jgi:6-pyruvoyltetrahydropterin/6-carboxytetrahydropterin synthase